MTAQWRNYSGNLHKIFIIVGPTTFKNLNKLIGSQYPAAQFL